MDVDPTRQVQTRAGSSRRESLEKVIGPIDLHYHFRTRPLFRFLSRRTGANRVRALEYGCGNGSNLIDMKRRFPEMEAVGIDMSSQFIAEANASALKSGLHGLRFICSESPDALGDMTQSFDFILLIDVLEHLDHPNRVLLQLGPMLKPGGHLLISVPTHRYPKVFGRKFHEAVGHVRDGYSLEELDKLIGNSYDRVEVSYNTGLVAGAACALFYRFVPKIRLRKLAIASTIGLHVFRWLDVINGKSISCSLWSVYRASGRGCE